MPRNDPWLIDFAVLLPWPWLVAGILAISVFILLGAMRHWRGWPFRAAALLLCWLMLLNPVVVEQTRDYKPDKVLLIADQTSSNQISARSEQTNAAIQDLQKKLAAMPGIELRSIAMSDSNEDNGGSLLFEAIAVAAGDLPLDHIGAIIAVTDGQIHDRPRNTGELSSIPLHVLLTGEPDEIDYRLDILRSPGFGIVGQTVPLRLKISGAPDGANFTLSIRNDQGELTMMPVVAGAEVEIPLSLPHAGANIFTLSFPGSPEELTHANNEAVINVNGVRDRLRVLLISGDPHPGTRIWRNYLKSDPGVDLVHFTILRPPEKQDAIPTNELSLIAFPTKELFEEKLHEFDLIIFDRYRRLGSLSNEYLTNIVRYVENGGALLDAEGPLPPGALSLFDTPIGAILPSISNEEVQNGRFVPEPTAKGLRHPVIAGLPGLTADSQPRWGPWLRQTSAQLRGGDVLLNGLDNQPLLVLNRVGQGRVAQLFSDQIWLWARGYEGGGPHSELLRRLSHWLMKEPQLEENDLRAEAVGRQIHITQRSLDSVGNTVLLEKPNGQSESIPLNETAPGLATARIQVTQAGLYRIGNGQKKILVGVGGLNPLEFHDMRSTAEKIAPYLANAEGSVRWLSRDGTPDLRHLLPNRQMSGQSWLGIRRNQNYAITGIVYFPLLPPLAYLLLGIGLFLLAWRQEGR